jgi:hypothetical protein
MIRYAPKVIVEKRKRGKNNFVATDKAFLPWDPDRPRSGVPDADQWIGGTLGR